MNFYEFVCLTQLCTYVLVLLGIKLEHMIPNLTTLVEKSTLSTLMKSNLSLIGTFSLEDFDAFGVGATDADDYVSETGEEVGVA